MKHWNDYPVPSMRQEALFGDRIVSCFAGRPQSLYAMFERSLAARPQAEAMVCGDQHWTYAQLEATSARLAAGLQTHGVTAAVPVGVREQRPGLA